MTLDKNNLYALTPSEFDKLCVEILKAQGLERVEFVGGLRDQGVDIVGETGGQQIAVQVKHMKQLAPSTVRRIIAQVQASSYRPNQLVIMTSATLSSSLRASIQESPSDMTVKLIGQDEILQVLTAVPTLFEQEQLFWHIVIVFDGVILRKHL
jgi:HJR/Mrr/RecB family endonuclease